MPPKKLHHAWFGPFQIIKQLSDATYIADTHEKHNRQVVHFDQLKLCPPDTRLPPTENASQVPTAQSMSNHSTEPFRTHLQLIDNGNPSGEP